jgi:bacterioferritin
MKGHPEVIAILNDVLGAELVAINQYFLHAKMCQDWGYLGLAAQVRAESIDEMKHAESLIDRVLFLDGMPNLQKLGQLHIGETVREQFESDLRLEYAAVERLNNGTAACRKHGDHASEELLRGILVSEEEHIDWIETQLSLMDQLGEAHYLAQQVAG